MTSFVEHVNIKQRGTKEPLDEREEETKKAGLKHNIQKTKIMAWSHHFMANRWRNNTNSDRLYFGWAPKSLQMVTAATKL